ncbi:hypothetical protein GCM10023063_01720 [Arthrobacter methylotrophus]
MLNYAPAFLSDMRRPWLWKGSAIGTLLVAGLIGGLVVAAAIGPEEESGHAMTGGDRILLDAGLSLLLTAAAVVGSFSFTSDFNTRSFYRRILVFQRGAAFTGRAASTTVVALLAGTTIGVLFGLAGELGVDRWHVSTHVVVAFAGVSGMGSLWGFAIGSLIRNHLLSLFVVPLSLVLPTAVGRQLGHFVDFLFPNLLSVWAKQGALESLRLDSLAGAAMWLAFVLGAGFWVFLKRDLA